MKIRLHEVELGADNVAASTKFFESLLGLTPSVQQEGLTVFASETSSIDFNVSNHLPAGTAAISFITDNLSEIERRLKSEGIAYEGPTASHLGMSCIQLKSPDGYFLKINTPGAESPEWLQV